MPVVVSRFVFNLDAFQKHADVSSLYRDTLREGLILLIKDKLLVLR